MTRFRVELIRSCTVEAVTEEEARQAAIEEHPKMRVGADTIEVEPRDETEQWAPSSAH